jgi:hypothetical protein
MITIEQRGEHGSRGIPNAESGYLGTPSADIEALMFAVVICNVREL